MDTPVLKIDHKILRHNANLLKEALPNTKLHYAIKALPELNVIKTFHNENLGFDVASQGEIELLRQAGVSPLRTIHSHPIKTSADIESSLQYGCTSFTIDNVNELSKFVAYKTPVPTGLMLRIGFRSPDAVVDLSKKFGCAPHEALGLIKAARDMGLLISGLSFHVGSQTTKPITHVAAINECGRIIQTAEQDLGVKLTTINIGGGFPVKYDNNWYSIKKYCTPINAAIQKLPDGVKTIAEPGRFLVASAGKSIARIIGKSVREGKTWYFIDDGVYGNYSGTLYDHAAYPITPGTAKYTGRPVESCVLAGPTCDSIDIITEDIMLPDMKIGDTIVGHMMGAYTWASATEFNSYPKSVVMHKNTERSDD